MKLGIPQLKAQNYIPYQQMLVLSIFPRPTVEELTVVLNPICYLGPYDHNHYNHNGTCSDQIYCCLGWIPIPDKPGLYDYDRKIFEERVSIERETYVIS